MTPTYASKNGVRYRYYVSSALFQGRQREAGSLNRIPAAEIETVIANAIRDRLQTQPEAGADRELVFTHVTRVDVSQDSLNVTLTADQNDRNLKDGADPSKLLIAWRKARSKKPRDIILPAGPGLTQDRRPIRAETRAKLVSSIARGRRWLDDLVAGTVTTIDQIAARERCSIRQVNMTISLAFLAPTLVSAAIEGRLPRGIGVTNLRDAPLEWSRQLAILGCRPNYLSKSLPISALPTSGLAHRSPRQEQNFLGQRPPAQIGRKPPIETASPARVLKKRPRCAAFCAPSPFSPLLATAWWRTQS